MTQHRVATSIEDLPPWMIQAAVLLGFGGFGLLVGMRLIFFNMSALLTLAILAAIGLSIAPLIGFRGVPLAGLLFFAPITIVKHLTYVDHVGSSDGLTIEIIDIWMAWLVAQYAYL